MYDNPYNEIQRIPPRNPMATAALTFGILSLLSCSLFYAAIPCGALAVIFAVLSRSARPMPGKSRTGLICGICGIAAAVIITVTAFYTVLTDTEMRSYLEYYLQIYTGDSDITLEEIFPFLAGQDGTGTDRSGTSDENEEQSPGNDKRDEQDHDGDKTEDNGHIFISNPSGTSPFGKGVFL